MLVAMTRSVSRAVGLLCALPGVLAAQTSWQAFQEERLWTTPFGAVAISGDTMLIGDGSISLGFVFVRLANGWQQQAKLVGTIPDGFGHAVALQGDTAVIGAPRDDVALPSGFGPKNAGSARVFTRTGTAWSQTAKLLASDPNLNDGFGFSVALHGDRILVGSEEDDEGGQNAGAAYVFARNGTGWVQEAKFVGQTKDRLGHAVALHGNTAMVGAPNRDPSGLPSAGAVLVFGRQGTSWVLEQELHAGDASAGAKFGWSLALAARTLIVGAPRDTHAGLSEAGAAYAFELDVSGWVERQKLVASPGASGDRCGDAVALALDLALVSAPGADPPALPPDTGSAFLFARSGSTWTEQLRLEASSTVPLGAFGDSIALSPERAVVAASDTYYIIPSAWSSGSVRRPSATARPAPRPAAAKR